MGTKFSKASSGTNGKVLTQHEKSTKKLNGVKSESDSENLTDETSTLPRNFERSRSLSKRFRRSCRNWAVGRGLIGEKKHQESTKKEEEIETKKEEEKELADSDLALIDLEETPELSDNTKDVDIGSIVAELVLDAKKRKEELIINNSKSIEKVDEALEEKCEEEALETLVKAKAINEIQVTLEESTVEATTPSILHTNKTEEASDVSEKSETTEMNTNNLINQGYSIEILSKPEMCFRETSFDEPELQCLDIQENSAETDGGSKECSFYIDTAMSE